MISNNNLDKVYETLKDPDPIFKEKPVLKSEATNLKPIYKYSLIFVIIIVVVIIIMSLADRNTNYNDEVVVAERTNTEIPIKRKQQKKTTHIRYL